MIYVEIELCTIAELVRGNRK